MLWNLREQFYKPPNDYAFLYKDAADSDINEKGPQDKPKPVPSAGKYVALIVEGFPIVNKRKRS
jgi:hypothetical protein